MVQITDASLGPNAESIINILLRLYWAGFPKCALESVKVTLKQAYNDSGT